MLKHVTLDGVQLHLNPDENKLWINSKYVLFLNDTTRFILETMIERCYPQRDVVPADFFSVKVKKNVRMRLLFNSGKVISSRWF